MKEVIQVPLLEQTKNYQNIKSKLEKSVGLSFSGPAFSTTAEKVKAFRELNNDPYGQEHDTEIVPQVMLLNTWASVYGSYSFFEQVADEIYNPKKFEIKALNLSVEQVKPVPVNTEIYNKMTLVSIKPNDQKFGIKAEIKYEVVLPDGSIAASGSRIIIINSL